MTEEKNYQNKENIGDIKFWMGEDGIVRINTGKEKWNMEIIDNFTEKFIEFTKKLPKGPKLKVLIDINLTPPTPTAVFRKRIVSMVIKVFKNANVEKVAIWGGKGVIKVVTSFFLAAAKIKTVKYFNTEEESLKWLKED